MKFLRVYAALAAFFSFIVLADPDPVPIVWTGGTEFVVPNAPAGFEAMHYGVAFSTTIAVPDDVYAVTLKFIEPTVTAPGQRVFDVAINDQTVIQGLDLVARMGVQMRPLYRVHILGVRGGKITIAFRATVRSAVCSGITIEPLQNLLLTTN